MSLLRNSSTVLVGRAASAVIQIASAAVLARLLTPEQFGTFAVAAGTIGLIVAFREFGTSNYLIRAATLSRETVGSVVLVSVLLSWTLGLAVVVAVPWLVDFFGAPELRAIFWVLAANFVIAPFTAVASALLRREERFTEEVIIGLVAASLGAAVMILLALFGVGAMSLALGALVSTAARLILTVGRDPAGFTVVPALGDIGQVVSFGSWLTAVSVSTQLSERSPELVIGRLLGLSAAGFFDKAAALMRLVNQLSNAVVQGVVFPVMSRERRNSGTNAQLFVYRLEALASIVWPIYAFLAIEAGDVILLLFGPQWAASVPVASWLALSVGLIAPFMLGDQVLIAAGKLRGLFIAKAQLLVTRVVAMILAAPFGLSAVAVALIVPAALYLVSLQYFLRRELSCSVKSITRPLLRALLVTIVAVGATLGVRELVPDASLLHTLGRLALTAAANVAVILLLSYVLPSPLRELRARVMKIARERGEALWSRYARASIGRS